MISIWSQFSRYWQSKGWLWLLITAVSVLIFCWIVSEKNNTQGTWDKFIVTDKGNYDTGISKPPLERQFFEKEYFPQSIKSSNGFETFTSAKRSGPPVNSKGETICRDTLQYIFNDEFPKCRPDFLFNSVTGENLELDMYNKNIDLR